jgi:SAM-dependent methyltransferase
VRLPNTASVNFVGQVGAEVLARVPGLAASTGSACHADSVQLSPVLAAMQVSPREGMGAVRFSLGRTTTWDELEHVLAALGVTAAAPRPSLRDHWQNVYEQKGEDDVSWFQARPDISLALVMRTGVGRDARIVDVGGGASRLVDALLDSGVSGMTVVDIAAAALERARSRLGPRASAVTWVTSDVAHWKPDSTFDVWHDRAVFHFMVREDDRETYVATLRRALRPGGHAIIGTFASDGPERCSGLPVRRYEPETLAAELGTGFQLVDSVRDEHMTPGGKIQRFQFSRFVRE